MRTVGEVLARAAAAALGRRVAGFRASGIGLPRGLGLWLRLDASLARQQLGWLPRWGLDQALAACAELAAGLAPGHPPDALCLDQWRAYIGAGSALAGPEPMTCWHHAAWHLPPLGPQGPGRFGTCMTDPKPFGKRSFPW